MRNRQLTCLRSTGTSIGATFLIASFFTPLANAQCTQGVLQRSVLSVDGRFGTDIAVEGDLAVIGSAGDAGGVGRVQIFVRDASMNWVEQQELAPLGSSSVFGAKVAIFDEFIAVSSRNFSQTDTSVDLYAFDGANWVFTQRLMDNFHAPGSEFGAALAFDGDRLFVGAPFANNIGAVFMFMRDRMNTPTAVDDVWTQMGDPFNAKEPVSDMAFGFSLAAQDSQVIVGAPGDLKLSSQQPAGIQIGSVFFYVKNTAPNGPDWIQKKRLRGTPHSGELFGYSVAISGDKLIVGAPGEQTGIYPQLYVPGGAFVFDRLPAPPSVPGTGYQWVLNKRLINLNEDAHNSVAGIDVDILGNMAVVGAPFNLNISATPPGIAYGYFCDNGIWELIRNCNANGAHFSDRYGLAVAVTGQDPSDGFALVGAPNHTSLSSPIAAGQVENIGASMGAFPPAVAAFSGGSQKLLISAGEKYGGQAYWIFGSVTGTSPGIPVGAAVLPLVFDAYFAATLTHPTAAPFADFTGTLDEFGNAEATLAFNPIPSLIGATIYHSYLIAPTLGGPVVAAGNAVSLAITP